MSTELSSRVKELAIKANTCLREDVRSLLEKAYFKEKNKKAQQVLGIILENAKIAKRGRVALCQDTGLPLIFLEVGRNIALTKQVLDEIEKGVVDGYQEGGFRASTIDEKLFLSYSPKIFHIKFSSQRGLKVTVFPKGFGAENKSRLKIFLPTASGEEIEEFVVETIKKAGPDACPPYFVGVGIGGSAEYALLLAKEALLERLDKPNRDKELARWERVLCRKINRLALGPMGFGGRHTVLAVRIKRYPTHIAGLPVGINLSCHALRSASLSIEKVK